MRASAQLGIVQNRAPEGMRSTTYDATVGEIIHEGITYEGAAYTLPPRGMVWVVSEERFSLPTNITGLATLRTSWTHNGILALNVGIVDPGWNGQLAAALVNFSKCKFEVRKGNGFLRVLFIKHNSTNAKKEEKTEKNYLGEIRDKSGRIPSAFLDMKSLTDEVLGTLSGSSLIANRLARYGVIAGFVALLLALYAILLPIVYGITSDFLSKKSDIQRAQEELTEIRNGDGALREQIKALQLRMSQPLPK
jgi:deoxycytidine triphosphate deaminase